MLLCHCLSLLVAMVTKMQQKTKQKKTTTKTTFKNLLWNHWSDWAQILHVASLGLGNESLFFYENRPISFVAMATKFPLTFNGENRKMAFTAKQLKIF